MSDKEQSEVKKKKSRKKKKGKKEGTDTRLIYSYPLGPKLKKKK